MEVSNHAQINSRALDLYNTVATSHRWLFKIKFQFQIIKIKNSVPHCISHISSVQYYRTFPSSQKILLNRGALEQGSKKDLPIGQIFLYDP